MKKSIFVHDWIYHIWWAEKVFIDIIKHYILQDIDKNDDIKWSDYIIYTLFSDKKSIKISLDNWYQTPDIKPINHDSIDSLLDDENKQAIKDENSIISDKEELKYSDFDIEVKTTLPRWIFGVFKWFEKKQIPFLSKIFDYRNLMFFYPILIRWARLDIKKYNPDRVVISSFAVVKNILATRYRQDNNINTILYLHSPYMFLWNHFEKNRDKLNNFIWFFYNFAKKLQTNRDLKTIYTNEIKYNSFYTKSLIDKIYYGKVVVNDNKYDDNFIRYPKANQEYIDLNLDSGEIYSNEWNNSDYYIYIWRIVRFSKELENIVKLFDHNGRKLYIIWSWPDEEYLKSISWENINWLGYIWDVSEKIKYMRWARWCINLTLESFWLVNIESLLCGIPIFGLDKWWTREIVDDQEDISYLVKKIDQDSLIKEFEIFEDSIGNNIYNPANLRKHGLELISKYCNW